MPAHNDSFTNSDDTGLNAHDSNWDYQAGSDALATIQGNQLEAAAWGAFAVYYSTSSEGRAKITLPAHSGSENARRVGPAINAGPSGSGIVPYFDSADATHYNNITILDNGGWVTTVGITGSTYEIDAINEIEIVETSNDGTDVGIEVFINGTSEYAGTITDANATSGNDGIYSNRGDNAEPVLISAFSSGEISTNPILSSGGYSGVTTSTATLTADTDQGNGTVYAVIDTAANLAGITEQQIKDSDNANDVSAAGSNSGSVSSTDISLAVSGMSLSEGNSYSVAMVQTNANGDSNILTFTFSIAGTAGFVIPLVQDDGVTPAADESGLNLRIFSDANTETQVGSATVAISGGEISVDAATLGMTVEINTVYYCILRRTSGNQAERTYHLFGVDTAGVNDSFEGES